MSEFCIAILHIMWASPQRSIANVCLLFFFLICIQTFYYFWLQTTTSKLFKVQKHLVTDCGWAIIYLFFYDEGIRIRNPVFSDLNTARMLVVNSNDNDEMLMCVFVASCRWLTGFVGDYYILSSSLCCTLADLFIPSLATQR